ncbi:MAG TPA: YbhN family protein [Caldilineaceae bacterium]|nr:YbhN family protein [Caldilineaceae bacterium]
MMNPIYQEEQRPAPAQTKAGWLRWSVRYLVAGLILALGAYFLYPQLPSLTNALHVAGQMSRWLILLAVILQVGSYLGSGYLMQSVVRLTGQRISLLRGIVITLAANSVSLLAGGTVLAFALTYRWMRSSGVSREGAGFACTLPWVFNNLVLVLFAVTGLLYLVYLHKLTTAGMVALVSSVLLLVLVVLVVAWGIRYQRRLTRLAHWVAQRWATFRHKPTDAAAVDRALGQLFDAWKLLRQGGWRAPLLGAVLNNGLDILMLYILFIAAGHRLGLGALLAGYGLPLLLGKLGILPGGLGIVEGSMAVIYGTLGLPTALSLVVILVYRLLAFWIPTVLGFLLVAYLQQRSRSIDQAQ